VADTVRKLSTRPSILGQPKPKSDPPRAQLRGLPSASEVEAYHPESIDVHSQRETRTAAELAQMIEADLAKRPHCRRKGFAVTGRHAVAGDAYEYAGCRPGAQSSGMARPH
jgi:hypothetical protein